MRPWSVLLLGLAVSTIVLVTPRAAHAQGGDDRPFLGVSIDQTWDGPGVRIEEVFPSMPADEAGLRAGDLILAVNGRSVTSFETLVGAIQRHHPGDTVRFRIQRSDRPWEIDVKLGQRPAIPQEQARPPPDARPWIGVETEDLTVTGLADGSTGAWSGLAVGDKLLEVDWLALRDDADLQRRISSASIGRPLVLSVQRGESKLFFRVEVGFRGGEPRSQARPGSDLPLPDAAPPEIRWSNDLAAALQRARDGGQRVLVEVWGKG